MCTPVPIAIALGSNLSSELGTPVDILNAAIERLRQLPQLDRLEVSSWYRTAPIGPAQPDYINGCAIALVAVTLDPHQLLQNLHHIEADCGRVRTQHWGARTLDLDLILWGDRIIATPTLTVPHPRFRDRAFVLVPLAEIAPQWRDPQTQATIATLAARCPDTAIVQASRLPSTMSRHPVKEQA
ncbi:MAG: 2-amino-4-hydroxy-6-hydroxymethyldihydropteridine diphosphokinase [Oscillatoriales cyanobacterium]|nr:MAG: 2-amino-4-hydroxy-6-hydroxymethyldihydropteridine diphosphokinase [Oscillatoriales cyanobacterium]